MDQYGRYYNLTLRFLSFRPRSKKEVSDYLKRKKADPLLINKIINKLEEYNFINDEEFAKWWIEQRTVFKPRSSRLIKMELRQKGISNEIIESEIFSSEAGLIFNEIERAKKIVESKIYKYKGLPRQEIFRKLGGLLVRRGFSYDVIKQSIDEILTKVV